MITRAQDYQTITPVGIVNGGILPARDVAADGSSRVFRAEDLDFMIEAGNERRALFGRSAPVYPHAVSPSMVCDHNDWSALAFDGNGPGGFYYSFFKGETDRDRPVAVCINPAEPFQNIGFTATSLPERLGTLYPGSVLSANLDIDIFYYPLKLDTLRRFYYDLSRADRLMFPYLEHSWTGSVTSMELKVDPSTGRYSGFEEVTSPLSNGRLNYLQSQIDYFSAGFDTTGPFYRYLYGFKSASVALALPSPSLVSSAQLVVLYHVRARDAAARRTYSGDWAKSYTMAKTAQGVSYTGGIGMWSNGNATQTGVRFPDSYPDDPDGVPDMNWAEWYIKAAWAVVWYNFRTEIRSLNWQWTP